MLCMLCWCLLSLVYTHLFPPVSHIRTPYQRLPESATCFIHCSLSHTSFGGVLLGPLVSSANEPTNSFPWCDSQESGVKFSVLWSRRLWTLTNSPQWSALHTLQSKWRYKSSLCSSGTRSVSSPSVCKAVRPPVNDSYLNKASQTQGDMLSLSLDVAEVGTSLISHSITPETPTYPLLKQTYFSKIPEV